MKSDSRSILNHHMNQSFTCISFTYPLSTAVEVNIRCPLFYDVELRAHLFPDERILLVIRISPYFGLLFVESFDSQCKPVGLSLVSAGLSEVFKRF